MSEFSKLIEIIRIYYLTSLVSILLLMIITNNNLLLIPIVQVLIIILFLIREYPMYHENLAHHHGIFHIIIFLTNIAAVFMSTGDSIKAIAISIIYSLLLLISTSQFITDKSMLIILFTSVINLYSSNLGFNRSIQIMICLLIINWFIPLLVNMISSNEQGYNNVYANIKSNFNVNRSLFNFIYSETIWFQVQLRRLFLIFQKTLWSSLLFYMIIYILLTVLILIKFNQIAFSISYILLTADISSRITVKNIVINPKIMERLNNNLPEIQKRHMNKMIQVVGEAVAKEPVATAAVVGTVVAAGLAYIANHDAVQATEASTAATKEYTAATERSTAAAEASTAATKEYTAATERSTAAAEASTAATKEYTASQNKQWALSELDNAKTSAYKQDLLKVFESGDIMDINLENVIKEKESKNIN